MQRQWCSIRNLRGLSGLLVNPPEFVEERVQPVANA